MGREKPIRSLRRVMVCGKMMPIYTFYYSWEDCPCLVQSVNRNHPGFPWARAFIYTASRGFYPTSTLDVTFKGYEISKERYNELVDIEDNLYLKRLLEKENEKEYKKYKQLLIQRGKEYSFEGIEKNLRWTKREIERLATSDVNDSESNIQGEIEKDEMWEMLQEEFWVLVKNGHVTPRQLTIWLLDISGKFKDKEISEILNTTILTIRQTRHKLHKKIRDAIKKNME